MQPIRTDPQTGILYRRWQAASPKAVLLLVHGLGGHSARWSFLADYFQQNNISSYGIELKGFGETQGLRGHIDSFKIYYNDVRSLYRIIKNENPDKKVFILGESMGGLMAFLMVITDPNLFSGVICLVPAFASAMKFSILEYVKILSSVLYNRRKQFTVPFTSQMCTQDVEYQKVMDSDTLKEHRLATSGLLFNILIEQVRAQKLKDKLITPVLFQLAGKDVMADARVGRKAFQSLKLKDKTIIEYPDMFHALSIELERKKVFDDTLKWMQTRV